MNHNLRLIIDSRVIDGKILAITLPKIEGSNTWDLIHEGVRYVVCLEK